MALHLKPCDPTNQGGSSKLFRWHSKGTANASHVVSDRDHVRARHCNGAKLERARIDIARVRQRAETAKQFRRSTVGFSQRLL
jgi:hypothetical protein